MKRRSFIKFTTISTLLLTSNISIAKTIPKESVLILEEVYMILFPKTNTMPSAKEFGAVLFLLSNLNEKSFDDYDKTLVLDGTKDFSNSFPNFLALGFNEKKVLIESIVNSNEYAQSWISKLVYFGIEAMLGDPIYQGNTNEIGWKSVNHFVGYPQPQKRYGKKL